MRSFLLSALAVGLFAAGVSAQYPPTYSAPRAGTVRTVVFEPVVPAPVQAPTANAPVYAAPAPAPAPRHAPNVVYADPAHGTIIYAPASSCGTCAPASCNACATSCKSSCGHNCHAKIHRLCAWLTFARTPSDKDTCLPCDYVSPYAFFTVCREGECLKAGPNPCACKTGCAAGCGASCGAARGGR